MVPSFLLNGTTSASYIYIYIYIYIGSFRSNKACPYFNLALVPVSQPGLSVLGQVFFFYTIFIQTNDQFEMKSGKNKVPLQILSIFILIFPHGLCVSVQIKLQHWFCLFEEFVLTSNLSSVLVLFYFFSLFCESDRFLFVFA